MGKIILGMTMSLDGFVEDQDGSVAELYHDLAELPDNDYFQKQFESIGAVVMGRNAFDMEDNPDEYADHYELQVPIFVLTHQPPEKHPRENENLTFTFVTDGLVSAIEQAKAAAGDKDVTIIGGASTFQQCMRAGLVDELQIDIMPVLFGKGLRLFDNIGDEHIKLEKIELHETPVRTSFQFRVIK